ncbi:Bidirectional sugar transporter SWEET14 [Apostasia shenzhenica]|uniref:Bidirectional sugar transporter SWEET n=1 Tax=Apostasia shenzhenica TaxID=1088818 RepID=A0A2H9ZWF2_9ASPA|nr:Bidirectional sugar transporter SWEET14 [Apostasia shenzhenica]
MVYLAPVSTFYRVYQKKSTEGFQSLPYSVALFSSMLWVYYAVIKSHSYLLITINSIGCIIETIYIAIFLFYAPRSAKMFTLRVVVFLNVIVFGLILLCTLLLSNGGMRITILGWICVSFSVSVFAAPLSIIRLVIHTKSVEYMPFNLSFFLTLSAAVWLGFGLLSKDKFVAIPNIVGLVLGILQMALYCVFREPEPPAKSPDKGLPEHAVVIPAKVVPTREVHPVDAAGGREGVGDGLDRGSLRV